MSKQQIGEPQGGAPPAQIPEQVDANLTFAVILNHKRGVPVRTRLAEKVPDFSMDSVAAQFVHKIAIPSSLSSTIEGPWNPRHLVKFYGLCGEKLRKKASDLYGSEIYSLRRAFMYIKVGCYEELFDERLQFVLLDQPQNSTRPYTFAQAVDDFKRTFPSASYIIVLIVTNPGVKNFGIVKLLGCWVMVVNECEAPPKDSWIQEAHEDVHLSSDINRWLGLSIYSGILPAGFVATEDLLNLFKTYPDGIPMKIEIAGDTQGVQNMISTWSHQEQIAEFDQRVNESRLFDAWGCWPLDDSEISPLHPMVDNVQVPRPEPAVPRHMLHIFGGRPPGPDNKAPVRDPRQIVTSFDFDQCADMYDRVQGPVKAEAKSKWNVIPRIKFGAKTGYRLSRATLDALNSIKSVPDLTNPIMIGVVAEVAKKDLYGEIAHGLDESSEDSSVSTVTDSTPPTKLPDVHGGLLSLLHPIVGFLHRTSETTGSASKTAVSANQFLNRVGAAMYKNTIGRIEGSVAKLLDVGGKRKAPEPEKDDAKESDVAVPSKFLNSSNNTMMDLSLNVSEATGINENSNMLALGVPLVGQVQMEAKRQQEKLIAEQNRIHDQQRDYLASLPIAENLDIQTSSEVLNAVLDEVHHQLLNPVANIVGVAQALGTSDSAAIRTHVTAMSSGAQQARKNTKVEPRDPTIDDVNVNSATEVRKAFQLRSIRDPKTIEFMIRVWSRTLSEARSTGLNEAQFLNSELITDIRRVIHTCWLSKGKFDASYHKKLCIIRSLLIIVHASKGRQNDRGQLLKMMTRVKTVDDLQLILHGIEGADPYISQDLLSKVATTSTTHGRVSFGYFLGTNTDADQLGPEPKNN